MWSRISSIQMIALSKTTGYATQALSCLSDPTCRCRSIADIAGCASVPKPYLAKIMNALVRAGLVKAKRGVGGGITLVRPPAEVSLLQIMEAVEGIALARECLLGLSECRDERACPVHEFWKQAHQKIERKLGETTLADVIEFERRNAAGKRRASKPKPSSS